MDIQLIRARLVATKSSIDRLQERQTALCKEAIKIIQSEPDLAKRKEMIDYLFADNVEDVLEHHIRKNFL